MEADHPPAEEADPRNDAAPPSGGAAIERRELRGAKGTRTPDPHTASVVRYQLRHSPELLHAPAHAVARTKLHHRSQQQQITWCGRFEDLATDRTCPGSQLMFANHSESPSASIT